MEIQYLNQYFKDNSGLLKLNYKLSVKLASHDAIHDLRVNIKRLNALFKVLNFQNNTNYRLKKGFIPVKEIFKIVGPLRDAQVLETLVLKYQSVSLLVNPILISRLLIEKNEIKDEFFNQVRKFNYLAMVRLFGIMEHHIQRTDFTFIQNQIFGLRNNHLKQLLIFSNPESDEYNLHSARKIIKDLGYFLEMIGSKEESDQELALIKEAGRYLGDWHDRLVLQQFLNQNSIKNQNFYGDTNELLKIVSDERNSLKEKYFSVLPLIQNANSQF